MRKPAKAILLATDKKSDLVKHLDKSNHLEFVKDQTSVIGKTIYFETQHLYITSDEEIKDGDIDKHTCIFISDNGLITTLAGKGYGIVKTIGRYYKIILTTDSEIIKDGVQAITDEFLEWFVKNPSCEVIEIETFFVPRKTIGYDSKYKIIIPKEELKQECGIGYVVSETNLVGVQFTLKDGSKQFIPKQETSVIEDLKDILDHVTKMNDRYKKQETLEVKINNIND